MFRRYARNDATVSRSGATCRAVWLRAGWLGHRVRWTRRAATKRAAHPGNMPRPYLSSLPPRSHGTVQYVITWRKMPRVLTSVPSSRADPNAGVSSIGGRCRASPGSCTASPSERWSRWDCCRPAAATKSPSSAPCVHTMVRQSRRLRAAGHFQRNGSPVGFRRTHSRESLVRASSRHTPSTAKKGRSFSRVPSLDFGWPWEGALGARLQNGFDTIYARQSKSVRAAPIGGVSGVGGVSSALMPQRSRAYIRTGTGACAQKGKSNPANPVVRCKNIVSSPLNPAGLLAGLASSGGVSNPTRSARTDTSLFAGR
jgi:hypothetical protein